MYCKKDMGEKTDCCMDGVSHSICDACLEKYYPEDEEDEE
jgi:hypothetical protein